MRKTYYNKRKEVLKIYKFKRKELVTVLDKFKDALTPKRLVCTNCGRKIEEGESFTATITMPSEKAMLVSRIDNAIARTANSVRCERCQ